MLGIRSAYLASSAMTWQNYKKLIKVHMLALPHRSWICERGEDPAGIQIPKSCVLNSENKWKPKKAWLQTPVTVLWAASLFSNRVHSVWDKAKLSPENSGSSSGSKPGPSCPFRIVARPKTWKQSHRYVLPKGVKGLKGKDRCFCLSTESKTRSEGPAMAHRDYKIYVLGKPLPKDALLFQS